jgi:hypothetical protein
LVTAECIENSPNFDSFCGNVSATINTVVAERMPSNERYSYECSDFLFTSFVQLRPCLQCLIRFMIVSIPQESTKLTMIKYLGVPSRMRTVSKLRILNGWFPVCLVLLPKKLLRSVMNISGRVVPAKMGDTSASLVGFIKDGEQERASIGNLVGVNGTKQEGRHFSSLVFEHPDSWIYQGDIFAGMSGKSFCILKNSFSHLTF